MAQANTSIYNLAAPNPEQAVTDYQNILTRNMDRQASGLDLAQKTQNFQDQQAQRQALQQNTDANGTTNQPAAVAQLAKQNPIAAQGLNKMLNQYGIDGAAQHAETMQDFFAHATPQDYAQRKQALIDKGFSEAQGLPEVYIPTVQQRGLIGSATGAQQVDMIKQQGMLKNQLAQKYIEQIGYVPADLMADSPYHIYGSDKTGGEEKNPHLIPGGVPPQAMGPAGYTPAPGSKLAKEGIEEYHKNVGAKGQNDPSYGQAGLGLYSANKIDSIFNDPKYKDASGNIDYGKINSLDAKIVAGEMAKLVKGGASPTEEETNSFLPHNAGSLYGSLKSNLTGKPEPMNNAAHFQQLHEYAQKLKADSQNVLESANDEAAKAGLVSRGNPNDISRLRAAAHQEINDKAYGRGNGKSSASPSGRITVVSPSGQIGHIPQSQLQDALSQGYKQQ